MERLSHPNLIRLYEVVESVQKMHIIMEYAPGGELCYRIINGGPCSEVDAKPIFFQVASAIHYMVSCNRQHCESFMQLLCISGISLVECC